MGSPKRTIVIGLLLTLCAAALQPTITIAAAQQGSLLEPGEVGLFFDPEATTRVANIPPFGTFDLYLVARVPAGGVAEYDLVEVEFPIGTLIQNSTPTLPEGSTFQLNMVADTCWYASSPNPPACPVNEGDVVALARYSMMRIGGSGTTQVCLENYMCSSFVGPVPRPVGYRSCEDPEVLFLEFTTGRFECLSLDGTVDAASSSWSTAKGWFGRRGGE